MTMTRITISESAARKHAAKYRHMPEYGTDVFVRVEGKGELDFATWERGYLNSTHTLVSLALPSSTVDAIHEHGIYTIENLASLDKWELTTMFGASVAQTIRAELAEWQAYQGQTPQGIVPMSFEEFARLV